MQCSAQASSVGLLGLLALASDEHSLHAGLAPLAAWWVLLYVATSVQEALGDNDKSD